MKSGEIMALVAPATSAADRKASDPTTHPAPDATSDCCSVGWL